MALTGARVLLVSNDAETLERAHASFALAGAVPEAVLRNNVFSTILGRWDVAFLFGESRREAGLNPHVTVCARPGGSPLVVVTANGPRLAEGAVVVLPSKFVWGWVLLDAAVRARVRTSSTERTGSSPSPRSGDR